MHRIARKATGSYRLTATAYDQDGQATPISGTVSVTLTRDGEIIETVTPTITAGTLVYTPAVAKLPNLGRYGLTWTGTAGGEAWSWETDLELVGGFYFTIGELRAFRPELADETLYPDSLLEDARDYAEHRFEAAANAAWVPRSRVDTLYGNGGELLVLTAMVEVTELTWITIDGTELTPSELAAVTLRRSGLIRRVARWPEYAEVRVCYVHGFDGPPQPVKTATMTLAAEAVLPSSIPSRATVMTNEVGSFRVSTADASGKTGIPEVDAVVGTFGYAAPVVG